MDHLKATFHEDLSAQGDDAVRVEGGRVHIREWNWPPHEVLESMGDDVYATAFKNWRQERREALLAQAEEYLDANNQGGRFQRLKAAYRSGMVLPFVGAGMSMSSGYPGWTTFLSRVWTNAGLDAQAFGALISAGQYEEAAQQVADTVGVGFNEQVESSFGIDQALRGPVQFLPFVFPDSSVVTTNFDSVVKRCYRVREAAPFDEELTGLRSDELARYMAAGRRVLLKLHGVGSRVRDRVLTASEYDVAYADPSELPRAVRSLCSRTLLFMGCSLSVDRLLSELRRHVDSEGHDNCAHHFAFAAAPADVAERRERERVLQAMNIHPIWYPLNEDDQFIEGYLYKLADGVIEL
jgi:SIR2-like domain